MPFLFTSAASIWLGRKGLQLGRAAQGEARVGGVHLAVEVHVAEGEAFRANRRFDHHGDIHADAIEVISQIEPSLRVIT